MKINEVAKLTGVTVRTLHYYDEIGLLHPSEITEAGYRLYGEKDLNILQQILFFRELDFPLATIKEIMRNPNYDPTEALQKQKELLLQKRTRLDGLITLLEQTLKGENTMSFTEFDTTKIEETKAAYAAEVKERWGTTSAYEEYSKKTKNHTDKDWNLLNHDLMEQFHKFADLKTEAVDSKAVQNCVKEFQQYMTEHYFTCTNEILSGLGLMYSQDERFKTNIDKAAGEGTAEFVTAAIQSFCS